ncbi:MAG: hypothetical protein HF982_15830 [Desulfobacteraceae bacterium]|nr:hypothetical protein [Desulfobacteraceae bacterium]MBC2721025.1 hypothetical protein [Desulfobacteraceae bacterium]
MKKKLSIQELRDKYQKLLANSCIIAVVKRTEDNTDSPTNEEEYLAKAKKNISILKTRIKLIQLAS